MKRCKICTDRKVVSTTEGIVITCPACGKIKPELLCRCGGLQKECGRAKEAKDKTHLGNWMFSNSKGSRAGRKIHSSLEDV